MLYNILFVLHYYFCYYEIEHHKGKMEHFADNFQLVFKGKIEHYKGKMEHSQRNLFMMPIFQLVTTL